LAQDELNRLAGVANTALLLTSCYFAAFANQAAHARKTSLARKMLVAACAPPRDLFDDPLQRDIVRLRCARAVGVLRGDRKPDARQPAASVPHLFGPAGFALVSQPEKLAGALPAIYRHLVG
jgi:hypothetical protein